MSNHTLSDTNLPITDWEAVNNRISSTLGFIMAAHAGQKYGDEAYWVHPCRVMCTVIEMGSPSQDELLAALLHDVVEDTEYTLQDLEELGYCDGALAIVDLLTKQPGTYLENINRIIDSGNRSAMRVKLADNMINISGDKSHMDQERVDRLVNKYTMSIDMLRAALGM